MTKEEKAKAYDEAIQRAKECLKDGTISQNTIEYVTNIFPELKESEDEKIRKRLVELVKQSSEILEKKNQSSMLTWLEKQESVGEIVSRYRTSWYNEGKIDGMAEGLTDDEKYQQGWHDALEKRGEQKATDEAEPKFKVGDWIMYNRDERTKEIIQVYDIRDSRYYFNDNIHFSWSVKECDEKCHLWTIQDAKDGDVLVYKTDEVEWIFIYREIVPAAQEVPHDLLRYYFLLEGNYSNWNGVSAMVTDDYELYLKPATKEQHDLLFQKMKENGYEWDTDKKELKKIEQKPIWSEKDEEMLKSIIATCKMYEQTVDSSPGKHLLEMQENWLKSLKPQPKQEWSEEDEKWLKDLISSFNDGYLAGFEMLKSYGIIDWLKSLKERYK